MPPPEEYVNAKTIDKPAASMTTTSSSIGTAIFRESLVAADDVVIVGVVAEEMFGFVGFVNLGG